MNITNIFLLGVLLLCTVAGCVSSNSSDAQSGNAAQQRDRWFNEPQGSEYLHLKGGKLITDNRIFEVGADHEAEAEKMLNSASITELDPETARRLVGDRFHGVEGFSLFLTRGLYYSKGTGSWRIYELGEKLQVAHFCLGNQKMEMHRQALVVLLKSKPAEVYTFCGVAAQ